MATDLSGDPRDELFLVRSASFDIALDIKTGDGVCHPTATWAPSSARPASS
ncbi:hypothetical protein H6G65_03090 [Microcystis elabens FACHB-917]|nr:hypothetical protein [Microcystis elabens FACHB-917]